MKKKKEIFQYCQTCYKFYLVIPMRKKITRYTSSVNEINALGTRISTLTDKELQDKTISLTRNNRSVF